jgi:hypothetical protein
MAHEPVSGRDNGTITPTASLSSMPYTPEESIGALKYLYRNLGKKTWGPMGFYDAFNQERNWYTTSYLAIDQGPIIGMIENYRSQLLLNNFMSNTEVQKALNDIGFTEDLLTHLRETRTDVGLIALPNPMGQKGEVEFSLNEPQNISLILQDLSGRTVTVIANDCLYPEGKHRIGMNNIHTAPGIYFLNFFSDNNDSQSIKLIIQ